MATYVILPGMTAGGYFMRKVATPIRKAGHEVFTPTYTGIGERAHLLSRDIDLDTHILDVLQVLKYEDLQDVILVGKSYSGLIITGVADRVPERIRHLVYLDGVVPQDGQSGIALVEPAIAAAIEAHVMTHGDGWLVPANTAVDPRLTDHPWQTLTQPIRLSGTPLAAQIPRTYIYCTAKAPDDVSAAPTQRGAERAKAEGWHYCEIAAGHEPELEKPDEVVAILLTLA